MGSCYVIMQGIKASGSYNVNASACAETGTSTLSDEDNAVYVTSLECMKAFPKLENPIKNGCTGSTLSFQNQEQRPSIGLVISVTRSMICHFTEVIKIINLTVSSISF